MTFRNQMVCADTRDYLRTLPDGSVNCVVTSPPYYALRDYQTGSWEGGDPDCQHSVGNQVQDNKAPGAITSGVRPGVDASTCRLCGAKRIDKQIGLEPTPAEYIANMVAVFREAWRVLRDDGTCFVNIGDSYASGEIGRHDSVQGREIDGKRVTSKQTARQQMKIDSGVRQKSLMLIPQRLAIALSDDGWIIRNELIWAKRNPMPSSVVDRWTTAHETVWFMTKSPRYWSDMYAVREANSSPEQHAHNQRYAKPYAAFNERAAETGQPGNVNNVGIHSRPGAEGRNARDVWSLSSEPSPMMHFAVMPSKLVENCLLAGCPETTCAVCGAPYTRVVERIAGEVNVTEGERQRIRNNGVQSGGVNSVTLGVTETVQRTDHGFRPTCTCNAGTVPGVVLDPFMGSGTIARTAIKHRRDFCGCDLNPEYVRMATESLDGLQVRLL